MTKKPSRNRRVPSQLLIFLGTAFIYVFLCRATFVIAYHPVAYGKLLVLHTLLFSPLFIINRFVFEKLRRPSRAVHVALVLTSYLAATALVWQINVALLPTMPRQFITMQNYIAIGDYLRDVHGINWYFIDWSGWTLAVLIYQTELLVGIMAFLFDTLLRRLPPRLKIWETST